ncbi:MAG: hypothetical protein M3R13_09075 [Armatimonadota bacterium]|nr:hypothetical protein [Armatimonadota bacterium]
MAVHPSVADTLKRLQEEAPGAPLLALGQTVFWDEPLKAVLPILAEAVGEKISLVAGVHDTDYFAKLPGGVESDKRFIALPKNDGSTRDFWSAAGEFSALFGSETPVTREALAEAGVSVERITKGDSDALDAATEAWGWRGIAYNNPSPKVTSEVPIHHAFDEIQATFAWALEQSRNSLEAPETSDTIIDQLRTILCDARDGCPGQTLAEFYECMLPRLHQIVTGRYPSAEITRTGKLLRFNTSTAQLPRFKFVDLFLSPETTELAKRAYNEAVAHTEVYTLDRFGTGAIPFDLVIPGQGRGTVRITSKMLVVMTPEPKFVKLEKPIKSIGDLAAATEKAFGNCVLVGKAITLIGMLSAEFVFAFHEGASMYVSHTRSVIENLKSAGVRIQANPILRISLSAWDALGNTDRWFRLPEPLRAPFGADLVSGATIARAWRCVSEQQAKNLEGLSNARNVSSLLESLQHIRGGRWQTLKEEYDSLRQAISPLDEILGKMDAQVEASHVRLREIKRTWAHAEKVRGEAFRSDDFALRDKLGADLLTLRVERRELLEKLKGLRHEKSEAASADTVRAARERRMKIEREAEVARLHSVREAIMATRGMEKTNRRPAAWWFPMVCPDGSWFESLAEGVQLRLEPLT